MAKLVTPYELARQILTRANELGAPKPRQFGYTEYLLAKALVETTLALEVMEGLLNKRARRRQA